MSRKIVVCDFPVKGKQGIASVLYDEQKAVEISLTGKEEIPILGNIYVGKVEKIDPGLSAAFVQIGKDLHGYLPVKKDGRSGLKGGSEILVQVEREAVKQKLPRLTTNLSLSGRYLVITSERKGLNFSRKLTPDEKAQIREKIRLSDSDASSFGVIVRTSAREALAEELAGEWSRLRKKMTEILGTGNTRTCFSCLYREEREWNRMIRQCSRKELERIVTDDPEIFEDIKNCLWEEAPQGSVSETGPRSLRKGIAKSVSFTTPGGDELQLDLYADPMLSLYKLYSLTTLTDSLLGRCVWLKSGGFLVIEQTEAFAAVDVNTGRAEGGKSQQELARRINFEAAAEAARQIRLRQLSGTILIDFINMKDPSWEKELGEYLQARLSGDPAGAKVVDFTGLHICEVTRNKQVRSLKEQADALGES